MLLAARRKRVGNAMDGNRLRLGEGRGLKSEVSIGNVLGRRWEAHRLDSGGTSVHVPFDLFLAESHATSITLVLHLSFGLGHCQRSPSSRLDKPSDTKNS